MVTSFSHAEGGGGGTKTVREAEHLFFLGLIKVISVFFPRTCETNHFRDRSLIMGGLQNGNIAVQNFFAPMLNETTPRLFVPPSPHPTFA